MLHHGSVHAFLVLAVSFFSSMVEECSASDRKLLTQLPFDPRGRAVCVSGTVNGRPQVFLIQTGSSQSRYSTSLRRQLGRYKGTFSTDGYNGKFPVEVYKAPHSRIGGISIHDPEDSVVCHDLERLSDVIGTSIGGVIGMDVLKDYVVGFDFDRGEFSLRLALPDDARLGSKLPLSFHNTGAPMLECRFAGQPHSIRIETGSDATGAIPLSTADKLFNAKKLHPSGLLYAVGEQNDALLMMARIDEFAISEFSHSDLVFATKVQDPQLSTPFVGLHYLKRFNLVFDFPRKVVYVRKSRCYARKDHTDVDGMQLVDTDDKGILVQRLINDGRAWHLGVRTGDRLLQVSGTRPRNAGHAIQLIGKRESDLKVQFRRESGPYSVTLPY